MLGLVLGPWAYCDGLSFFLTPYPSVGMRERAWVTKQGDSGGTFPMRVILQTSLETHTCLNNDLLFGYA